MASKKKKNVKINVIPILDAVFIFIFFLLMSAQFVDVYEIQTDIPKISTVTENNKLKPLNLTLKITQQNILITTGVEEKLVEKIERNNGIYDLEKLNRSLIKIKTSNMNEDSIVLKPEKSIAYTDIVTIIDNVRKSRFGLIKDTRQGKEGSVTDGLFTQVIFETII